MPRSDLVTTMLDERRARLAGGDTSGRPTDEQILEACRDKWREEAARIWAGLTTPMRRDVLRTAGAFLGGEGPVTILTGKALERRGLVEHTDWRRDTPTDSARLWSPTVLGCALAQAYRESAARSGLRRVLPAKRGGWRHAAV